MRAAAWTALWILLAGGLSWCAVGLMLGYARRRGLLDLPGRRRSHRQPTPRGGGIGTMLVLLLLLPWIGLGGQQTLVIGLSLAAVAMIGGWDDLAPRGIKLRLAIQLVAAAAVSMILLAAQQRSMIWLLLAIPLGVWSINLHNFMDGIDGLLAGHCVLVGAVLAILASAVGLPAISCLAATLAAVSAGFLCFNWAPARIFMGDAGSGGSGLLIFGLGLALVAQRPGLLWAVLALCSSFTVDASLTLLNRIWLGRRWTQPHREHLYQWLVRMGRGHAGVSLAYLTWDAIIGLWLVTWTQHHSVSVAECGAIYLLAIVVWLGYKSYCLRRRREREFS